jgi:hypothetical protein
LESEASQSASAAEVQVPLLYRVQAGMAGEKAIGALKPMRSFWMAAAVELTED